MQTYEAFETKQSVWDNLEREREREKREREERERDGERERERDAICAKECGGDRVRGIARARSELWPFRSIGLLQKMSRMFSNLRSKEEKEKIARKKKTYVEEEEEEATMLKKRLFAPTTQDDPTGHIL